jgi:L,D-transpeptidase ErfK/SrfK
MRNNNVTINKYPCQGDGRTMNEIPPCYPHLSGERIKVKGDFQVKLRYCGIVVILLILFLPSWSLSEVQPAPIDVLRTTVQLLRLEASQLEEENQGLRRMLKDLDDDEVYIVVDTESNRLSLRQGGDVLHVARCGTGSRNSIEEDAGRNWYFESPMGSLTVLGKERNPVWIRPDWSYVEENMPIPSENDPDRYVRDVLGKYALLLGNGYKIHGTKFTSLLGTHFTHGCVSLGDDDLEMIYKSVKIGTKVYLF